MRHVMKYGDDRPSDMLHELLWQFGFTMEMPDA